MELLIPDSGLLFWMLLSFGVVFFIVGRFGFPVITKMVKDRSDYINQSIESANEANTQLANIKAEANAILQSAKKEQMAIVNEASATRDRIIREARDKALVEGEKELEEVRKQIQAEKEGAIREIRSQVATLSVEIAQKVLRANLSTEKDQTAYIYRLLDEVESHKS